MDISFFDGWAEAWYPEGWMNEPGFLWPLFILGILCFFGFLWVVKQLTDARSRRMWKLWFGLGFLAIFIWSLPILLDTIVELIMLVLGLALVGFVIFIVFKVLTGSEDEGETSEEYIIKKEDGKEVIYEKGPLFDRKVGDLHNELGGGKRTRDILSPDVKVEKESGFSRERRAEVGKRKGAFRKGLSDKYPIFRPDGESDED